MPFLRCRITRPETSLRLDSRPPPRVALAAAAAALATAATLAAPAAAQPFANAKTARSGYTSATIAPRGACERLGAFKTDELVEITARAVAAAAGAGPLPRERHASPEIAFEVNLPARGTAAST